jgi:hypothetical protein
MSDDHSNKSGLHRRNLLLGTTTLAAVAAASARGPVTNTGRMLADDLTFN